MFPEIVELSHLLRWTQPIVWMLLMHRPIPKFNQFKPLYYSLIVVFIIFLYPPWATKFSYPSYLLMFYAAEWSIFTHYYQRKMLFNQAVSLSALVVFVGSFYWEIPAIIKHTVDIGLHRELVYRLFFIIVIYFLLQKTKPHLTIKSFVMLVSGVLVSIIVLNFYPNPNYVCWEHIDDWIIFTPTDLPSHLELKFRISAWIHLLNRAYCVNVLGLFFREAQL